MSRVYTVGSLFAGIEGFGLAFERNGFKLSQTNYIAFDNGQGDPNVSRDGTTFALNTQPHAAVAYAANDRLAATLTQHQPGQSNEADNLVVSQDVASPLLAWQAKGGFTDPQSDNIIAYGIYDDPTLKVGEDIMPAVRSREKGGGATQFVAAFDVRNLELKEGDCRWCPRPTPGRH